MPIDIRVEAAKYYDLDPEMPEDIPFYRDRIRSSDSSILELGCGTGRVLLPLVEECACIRGVDVSEAMVAICQEKLRRAGISTSRASVQVGDITDLGLDRTFDLITAPYRVFQNLETDADIDGFFATVRRHLSPGGRCVLNVFNPNRDPVALRQEWVKQEEYGCWEAFVEGERITCHARNARMDSERTSERSSTSSETKGSRSSYERRARTRSEEGCPLGDEFEPVVVGGRAKLAGNRDAIGLLRQRLSRSRTVADRSKRSSRLSM